LLLVFLEQGPHTTSLPGLFSLGPAALAESIGWTTEEFLEQFEELRRAAYAHSDWSAPLVWLPDSLRDFNAPENANIFKSWCSTFDELPDCLLKSRAELAISGFLEMMAETADKNARAGDHGSQETKDAVARAMRLGKAARLWRERMTEGVGDGMADGMRDGMADPMPIQDLGSRI